MKQETKKKKTHVEIPTTFTEPVGKEDLNGDGIGYVESYDFSRANLSEESRIAAISTVASVCYMSPKAAGSISLYNRLATESAGIPSSSFEFVPVLLPGNIVVMEGQDKWTSVVKFGEYVNERKHLLTNLRALIADVGDKASNYFNTEEECKIIAKHHKVFKAKIDITTRTQYMG